MEMKTADEILKMKATVLYLIEKCGGSVDYVKLNKLLYFAQQLHLVRYGRGIVNDTFRASDLGPVPSFIFKALKDNEDKVVVDKNIDDFNKGIFIIPGKPQTIKSSEKPDMDEFSVSDIKCLDEILGRYKNLTSKALTEISHRDKAWIDANNSRKLDPEKDRISKLDMAKSGGASNDMLSYILYEMNLDRQLS